MEGTPAHNEVVDVALQRKKERLDAALLHFMGKGLIKQQTADGKFLITKKVLTLIYAYLYSEESKAKDQNKKLEHLSDTDINDLIVNNNTYAIDQTKVIYNGTQTIKISPPSPSVILRPTKPSQRLSGKDLASGEKDEDQQN